MPEAAVHIFGVRHHGPGSARSLAEALTELKPDCVLIEGPPDADSIIPLAGNAAMKPPVALLVYDPEYPQRSCFYPFAVFSPEWQAIQFALAQKIPVRFMDLPQAHQLAIFAEREAKQEAISVPDSSEARDTELDDATEEESAEAPSVTPLEPPLVADPLSPLAQAAGYTDAERWWEHMVEHRKSSLEIFPAIHEAIAALREASVQTPSVQRDAEREARREAFMRETIRAAKKEGFQKIAVVCGAWHGPALANLPPAKEDAAILKGLPKRKVVSTWIPWTYSRLSFASGYGAGIHSPGWYDFLWHSNDHERVATRWLARVARLLRDEDLDASSASVIESIRLAEALSALRGRPLPGLPELNEATQTVLCAGDPLPLRIVWQKLIVSERLGETPPETPTVPLAQDLAREQKRLRLPPEASHRQVDLDLRKPNELDRSHLLHRLHLLGIEWGERQELRGNLKGTFHEIWDLQWKPEFAVDVIEAAIWGNTVAAAAAGKVRHEAEKATELQPLTNLLDSTLLADLPTVAPFLIERLETVAAVASDVGHLMDALPPLANIVRYGNVRKTDSEMVAKVMDGLVARICIGLPGACGSLNDEAAEEMFSKVVAVNAAISLLQDPEHAEMWHSVLKHLADGSGLHGLIAGRAARLLLDAKQIDLPDAARRLSLVLSTANAPTHAAAWVDGFIRNSGLLLLHDDALWNVLDEWVTALSADHFTATLPLLRRSFSTFQQGERRQLGTRVVTGVKRQAPAAAVHGEFNQARADRALPLLAKLLGFNPPSLP
ncbi:MAG TPA: DUF5682 family protein [Verrucomicrobiae bacterium]